MAEDLVNGSLVERGASMRAIWIALAAAVLLLACTIEDEADPAELSAWQFPDEVVGFTRVSMEGGVEAGEWIVGYNLYDPMTPIAATVIVYPSPGFTAVFATDGAVDATRRTLLAQDFDASRAALEAEHATAELQFSGETAIDQRGVAQDGLAAEYALRGRFAGLDQDLVSLLYLFRDGNWFVKYRVTYPAVVADRAAVATERFMDTLAWPAVTR